MKPAMLATWIVLIGAPSGAFAQDSLESSLFADGCAGIMGPDRVDCLRQEQGFSGTPFGSSTFGSSTFGGSMSVLDRLGISGIGSGSTSGSQGTANTPPPSSVGTTPSVTSSPSSTTPSTSPADSEEATGPTGGSGVPGLPVLQRTRVSASSTRIPCSIPSSDGQAGAA